MCRRSTGISWRREQINGRKGKKSRSWRLERSVLQVIQRRLRRLAIAPCLSLVCSQDIIYCYRCRRFGKAKPPVLQIVSFFQRPLRVWRG